MHDQRKFTLSGLRLCQGGRYWTIALRNITKREFTSVGCMPISYSPDNSPDEAKPVEVPAILGSLYVIVLEQTHRSFFQSCKVALERVQ